MPTRSVTTDIWSDPEFEPLSAHAKLVYLRLVVGPETTSAGVTRAPAAVLGASIGISADEASSALEELAGADLLRRYEGGWRWLPSFIRYQLSGPMFIRSIRRSMKGLPDALHKAIDRALIDKVGPEKARTQDGQASDAKGRHKQGKRSQTPNPTPDETIVTPESEGEKDQDQDQDPPSVGSGLGTGLGQASPPPALGGPASPPVLPATNGHALVEPDELVPITQVAAPTDGILGGTVAAVLERRRLAAVQAERGPVREVPRDG